MFVDILVLIGLGVLGIIFYSFYKARVEIVSNDFIWSKFLDKNKRPVLWAFIILILFSITIKVAPAVGESLKGLTGLAFSEEVASFFSLGWLLSALARNTKEDVVEIRKTLHNRKSK